MRARQWPKRWPPCHAGPDFEHSKPQSDTPGCSQYIASLADGEIYWVDNRNNRVEVVDATFRVQKAKRAENLARR